MTVASTRPATKRGHAQRPVVAKRPRAPRRVTIDGIYQRVLGATLEHQLPPGTQLVEERLAGIFGVSRTKIRQALTRLAHERIVTVVPHRGAFISSPTMAEAREVFEARRVIEPSLVRTVARSASPHDIARLREHVDRESAARAAGDKRSIIRLSGDFHQIIAEMAGNAFLARVMRELETLTCLVIILYDAPNVRSCPHREHGTLIDAIDAHDDERAATLMREHLNHVESSLDLQRSAAGEIDLQAVLS